MTTVEMHRIFQSFVNELSNADNVELLGHAMANAATALGLSCFAYLALPRSPTCTPILISNYPTDWTSHYLRNQYQRVDPVILRALSGTSPFGWGIEVETLAVSELQRELFERAAKFGIRCGFTIPIHDGGGPVAAVTFAADDRQSTFRGAIDEHGRSLQLMAMYFHASASRIVGYNFVDGVALTRREIQCLEWASHGKSAWDTGRILGISRHTVTFHLDNAKLKLGVRTVIQAVARFTASKTNLSRHP